MNRKAKLENTEPAKRVFYTIKLPDEQLEKLRVWCEKRLWDDYPVDYARFAYKGDNVNIVAYNSGKLVIQGKKTEEFVAYVLESEITGTPQMGYEEIHHPEWFEPHAGLDESGKGDLLGPLVATCVIADGDMVRQWLGAGLRESKRVTSDQGILKLARMVLGTKGVVVKTTCLGMHKYNELYKKFGSNLNKLLAWMHAKALLSALEQHRVSWGMLDQFSKRPLVQHYLEDNDFHLKMQTKAESDPVVAAASIVARATYIRQLKKLSEQADMPLLKGSGALAKKCGIELAQKIGVGAMPGFFKMHFKTAQEIFRHVTI